MAQIRWLSVTANCVQREDEGGVTHATRLLETLRAPARRSRWGGVTTSTSQGVPRAEGRAKAPATRPQAAGGGVLCRGGRFGSHLRNCFPFSFALSIRSAAGWRTCVGVSGWAKPWLWVDSLRRTGWSCSLLSGHRTREDQATGRIQIRYSSS